jgi:hypothetical protein
VRNRAKVTSRDIARETSPDLRARNIATSSRAKYRHIFAREISPDLRARNFARSSRAKYRHISYERERVAEI